MDATRTRGIGEGKATRAAGDTVYAATCTGTITLLNPAGLKVHGVSYTAHY